MNELSLFSAYDYLVECANDFMKLNDKTVISIKKLENYNQIVNTSENNKMKTTNIAQIDRFNFEQLKYDRFFSIHPMQGEVARDEVVNIDFTFDPGDYKSRSDVDDETKLNIENGSAIVIKLRGNVPPSEVNLESGDVVDYKAVHQGVKVKKTIVLKNYKPGIKAFRVEDIDNFLTFEPEFGS